MILIKMKSILISFEKSGWFFEQIKRQGAIAIYKRWKDGGLPPHYEVIRIQSHNGFPIPGTDKQSEPAEFYPSEKQWGTHGFTFTKMEGAEIKFHELTK